MATGDWDESDYVHSDVPVTVELSGRNLNALPSLHSILLPYNGLVQVAAIQKIVVTANRLEEIPSHISEFVNLAYLDVSNNQITDVANEIVSLKCLCSFIARNNYISDSSLPKDFGQLASLRTLNLAGNDIRTFPQQILELKDLESLLLGGNAIRSVPCDISRLQKLQVLYLGGNKLSELPATVGLLEKLTSLILCDNKLVSIPPSISQLKNLQSLSLHDNRLKTLPTEIRQLNLLELTLRENPLVVSFVQDLTYKPAKLLELAGRKIKLKAIPYLERDLPPNLVAYLKSAKRCVNPKCKGVYFESRVEHIYFTDFCGKYRLPLLEYLCSPGCDISPVVETSSEEENDIELSADETSRRMQRVLLSNDKPCPSKNLSRATD